MTERTRSRVSRPTRRASPIAGPSGSSSCTISTLQFYRRAAAKDYSSYKKPAASAIVPPVDSELEESDDEDNDNVVPQAIAPNEPYSKEEEQGSDDESEEEIRPKYKKGCVTYKWKKVQPTFPAIEWSDNFHEPPQTDLTPLEYFKMFIDDHIIDNVVEQTNLYSMQKTGSEIKTDKKEVQQFLGCCVMMGIVTMPSYKMYWATDTRYPKVADTMSLKRFEKLRSSLHFNDNLTKPADNTDKLFKIRPFLDAVQQNFRNVPHEQSFSIDEQMVPYKGRQTLKQYLPKKPHKWGFKLFVRAGVSGLCYDFEVYVGKHPADETASGLGMAADVVLRLTASIPQPRNSKLYFDNYFASVPLIEKLQTLGVYAVATLRKNRLANCALTDDKKLSKEGRGSYDFRVESGTGICVVKWFDNRCVQLVSSFVGVEPMTTVKRWNSAAKSRVDVPCPAVVTEYNRHMGGVDLMDMLIELYRTPFKTRRWYLKIVMHIVDMCIVNGWLLYRRHATQKDVAESEQLTLVAFRSRVAGGLLQRDMTPKRAGRPSLEKPKIKQPRIDRPVDDVRYDCTGHWPVYVQKRGRCKFCKDGFSRVMCEKCELHLCLTAKSYCFKKFHMKCQ